MIHYRYLSCYEKSFSRNDSIDYIGEHDWRWYKNRIINLSHDIIIKSGDEGELNMSELLDFLFTSLPFGFTRQSKQSRDKQKEDFMFIVNYTESTNGNYPENLYEIATQHDDAVNMNLQYPSRFINVIGTMGTKANNEEESTDIVRSIMNYLFCIEQILDKRNPYAGYQGTANTYFSNILEDSIKMQENL